MAAQKIGFIGTGVMGASMAGHLLDAGHELSVFNRTRHKADALVDRGARWCDTPGEVAASSDITFAIVGFPEDVRSVFLGEDGLLAGASAGSILVDMTTSSPSLAVEIAGRGAEKSVEVVDAPVSGGDVGAREARLSIMVGGSEEAFQRCLPFFKLMGANIVHQGPAGSGQHTKMCNQIAIASGMLAICEALIYAEKSGLDPRKVLSSIEKGAAGSWSLSNLGPRILEGNFEPGFYIKHFIKDMTIALESARSLGIHLPGLELTLQSYRKLQAMGMDDKGTQSLFHLYQSGEAGK
jgi:3-hydroxyisobutyrate dehydrogenase